MATDDVSYASLLEIKVGDGEWEGLGTAPSAVKRITAAGETTLSGRATDAAGNVSEIVTGSVKIDNVRPVGTAVLDAATRATTITATDAHSGVAKIEYRFAGDWATATADTPIPAPTKAPAPSPGGSPTRQATRPPAPSRFHPATRAS
ncbi:hypothetical protein [Tessaracoccus coleopterorum]|uniref:hypothetical protein n=1 Tax=Tessaracoccus coleopterorum TaxID=2714950 RepID=UPI001E42AF78|nr:hypothetical protein [Tessaracoccus coleopterorum]